MVDAAKLDASVLNRRTRHHGLLFALASVALVSVAQLLMKFAMTQISLTPDMLSAPLAAIGALSWSSVLLPLALGMTCYGISVVCWMGALARLPLSLAYPLLSLSYPLVYLGAIMLPFFNETLNPQRLVAIGLIMFGVALLMVEKKSLS